jgi:hypothetical protein
MKAYVGTKIIKAEGMSEQEFGRKYKGTTPEENQEDRSGYMIEYPDGYKSWSPTPTFEAAYREISDEEVRVISSAIVNGEKDKALPSCSGCVDEEGVCPSSYCHFYSNFRPKN